MGRLLLLCAGIAGTGVLLLHMNHNSLAAVLFWTALLAAVFGLLRRVRRPLTDLLEEFRRHAD